MNESAQTFIGNNTVSAPWTSLLTSLRLWSHIAPSCRSLQLDHSCSSLLSVKPLTNSCACTFFCPLDDAPHAFLACFLSCFPSHLPSLSIMILALVRQKPLFIQLPHYFLQKGQYFSSSDLGALLFLLTTSSASSLPF